MKKLFNLLFICSIVVLAMSSCGSDDGDGGTDPVDNSANAEAAALISGKTATLTSVTPPAGGDMEGWDNLTLTFGEVDASGGSVTVAGSKAEADVSFGPVWSNGENRVLTWVGDAGNQISIVGLSDMDAIVSESSLTLTFTVGSAAARTAVVDGQWTFVFALN